MNFPIGRNQTMKMLLRNLDNEFNDILNNLEQIQKRVTVKRLTEDQVKALQKETRELLYALNKKVMESLPMDSRVVQAAAKGVQQDGN